MSKYASLSDITSHSFTPTLHLSLALPHLSCSNVFLPPHPLLGRGEESFRRTWVAVHQAHLRYLPSHSVMRMLFYVKEGRTDQTLPKGEDVDVYVWQLAFFLSLFALL